MTKKTDSATPDEVAFAHAVETARASIPVTCRVVREEFHVGFTIVRQRDRYAVYSADAWERPKSTPFLPWSPPDGEPVADVAMDGTVTMRVTTDTAKATVSVWDNEAGNAAEVAPSEAVAGLLRYAKTLGQGTPAAGVATRRALALAREYGVQIGKVA